MILTRDVGFEVKYFNRSLLCSILRKLSLLLAFNVASSGPPDGHFNILHNYFSHGIKYIVLLCFSRDHSYGLFFT